jgi:hypothetical protein
MATFPSIFNSYPNVFKKLSASEYTFKYISSGAQYLLKDNFLVYELSGTKVGKWKWSKNKLTINFDNGKIIDWDLSLLQQLDDLFKSPPPKPKPKPKPSPSPSPSPKPKPEINDVRKCEWKPSEGMNFKCNTGCGFKIDDKKILDGIESGDVFREYVNNQFPEVAKKYNLDKKGSKTLDYCNSTIRDVWKHKYDSDDFPGLKGNTIGKIYIDGLKPETIKMDCKPWVNNNYFINDYDTEEERNNAAWKMIISYNNEFDMVLDSMYLKQCDTKIDNNLIWAEMIKSKDLYKHPVINFIANKKVYGEKWYDYWKKSLIKKESVTTHLIERKLKVKKKLKIMKENKNNSVKLVEKVSEKLKSKKIGKISENFFKQNYRKFFDSYQKYIKTNNTISESTNNEDFKKSFDSIFRGKEDEFRERAIEYIISKLEVTPSSPLATEITNELSKIPASDLFTNEYDIPDAVTRAIETTNQQLLSDESGLKGIVSKSVKIDDKKVKQEVRKHLHDYIESVKDSLTTLEQNIKKAVVSGF